MKQGVMIKLSPEQETYLRAAWADEAVTRPAIAVALNCCDDTVTHLAKALRLGGKACRNLKWPPEKVEELKRLFAEGISYNEIAKKIRVSRNGVAGMVFRLGLANTRPKMQPKPRPAKPKAQVRNTGGARKVAAIRKARAPLQPKSRQMPVLREISSAHAKPWTERVFGECAYPISGEGADVLSCCTPTGGHTYCAGHRAIMFAPAWESPRSFIRGVSRWAA